MRLNIFIYEKDRFLNLSLPNISSMYVILVHNINIFYTGDYSAKSDREYIQFFVKHFPPLSCYIIRGYNFK